MESVPATVNDYLGPVVQLGAVAHPWLRQLELVHLWLKPVVLFSVENEDVIDNALLAVALAPSKHNQELAKLGARLAIAG